MTIKKISAFLMVLIMILSISGICAINTTNNNSVNLTSSITCNNTACNESSPVNTSVIYVSTDGNDCNNGLTEATSKKTIQCAINTVADYGIIYVSPETYHENLKINKNVSIINPYYSEFYNNKEYITIDSNSKDSGVIVEKGNNVHIERIVITGGGIYNKGQMTITSSKVSRNKNHGITNTGNLTISYLEILNNENSGIINSGNLIITNYSMIQNNTNDGVINSGNLIITNYSMIQNNTNDGVINSGNLIITNYSMIQNNNDGGVINSGNANITYSGISGHKNSGIINSGNLILINSEILNNGNKRPDSGGIYNSRVMTIINSKIQHNKGNTGGIYNRGILSIQDSIISHNTGTIGGGICNNKKLNITNSYIHANQATRMGGGIYSCFDDLQTIDYKFTNNNDGSKSCGICKTLPCNNPDNFLSIVNCSIKNNKAGHSGGGIKSWSGLNIINSTVMENTVSISNIFSLLGGYNIDHVNCGGGIFVDGDLTITNCKIKDNKALNGGGIYHSKMCGWLTTRIVDSEIIDNKAWKGGGIYHEGDIILKNVKIKDNFAFKYRAIYNTNGYIFQDDHTEIKSNWFRNIYKKSFCLPQYNV